MAIDSREFLQAIKKIMGPVFESHQLQFKLEGGVYLWGKNIDKEGDFRAAISFERHKPDQHDSRYTFRINVSDQDILDPTRFIESYLPSKEVRKKLNIKRSILDSLSGYDWYTYPNDLQDKEEVLRMYAEELVAQLNKTLPKAIRWLNK